MKKRMFAIIMSIMMMVMIVPTVFAADEKDVTLIVTPDKKTAEVGDIITFTVSMKVSANVSSVNTIEFSLSEKATGLELVDRGAAADGVKETLGYDNFAWADASSLVVNGYGSAPKTLTGEVVLGSFQCKVVESDAGYFAKLDNVEFTDADYEALDYAVEYVPVEVSGNDSSAAPVDSSEPDSSSVAPVDSSEADSSSAASVESSKTDSSAAAVESSKTDDSSKAATSSTKASTTSSKAAANNSTKNPKTGSAAPVAMAVIALVGAAAIVAKKNKD